VLLGWEPQGLQVGLRGQRQLNMMFKVAGWVGCPGVVRIRDILIPRGCLNLDPGGDDPRMAQASVEIDRFGQLLREAASSSAANHRLRRGDTSFQDDVMELETVLCGPGVDMLDFRIGEDAYRDVRFEFSGEFHDDVLVMHDV
jgi:hypothetical protein